LPGIAHNKGVPKHTVLLASILLAASLSAPAQTADSSTGDAWTAMQALVGEWMGEGGGQPGQVSAGGFSFAPDLQGAVLVRKNFAEYPASKDRPAFRHDDLTIVSRGTAGNPTRATYFDNEGHVIEYSVSATADGARIEWVSAPQAGQPRFRFTYIFTSPDTLKLRFEIAPPGQPEKFSLYIEASAHRVSKK
jgi:hypothetical protein